MTLQVEADMATVTIIADETGDPIIKIEFHRYSCQNAFTGGSPPFV